MNSSIIRYILDETMEEQVRVTADGMTELEVVIGRGRSALRIDPGSECCLVYIQTVQWNGTEIPLKGRQIQNNGFRVGENTYVFPTKDPNITISLTGLQNEERNLLQVRMAVTKLPEETAEHMQKRGFFGV